MAENDIYNNRLRYEHFIERHKEMVLPPEQRTEQRGNAKYYCKNPENMVYYEQLFNRFAAKDISYIRRLRVLRTFGLITHATKKDFKDLTRPDIDKITAYMHKNYKSPKSKSDFIRDIKYLWKMLFPEKDEKGRIDETITPYVVRHLNAKIDKSREKRRKDRLSFEEFEQIVDYFSNDPRIQAFLMLAFESLARPQELLYTKVSDYEFYNNYAKVWISSHGKEGTGLLQCIRSYPYVIKWFKSHPLKNEPEAFFFLNYDRKNRGAQLKPGNINKKLKKACQDLGINKPVTCYSLKRNGVTMRILRGDSASMIQHAARWTSTKQLKTYDLSSQEDAFKIEMVKAGLIDEPEEQYKKFTPKTKLCPFCKEIIGFSEKVCSNCHHIVNQAEIKQKIEKNTLLERKIEEQQQQINMLLEFANKIRLSRKEETEKLF